MRVTIEDWHEVWEQLKRKYLQDDSMWRLLKLVKELGSAADAMTMMKYYEYREGYSGELKLALADAIAMIFMMCTKEGFNIEEVEKLAIDHLKEAIATGRLPK